MNPIALPTHFFFSSPWARALMISQISIALAGKPARNHNRPPFPFARAACSVLSGFHRHSSPIPSTTTPSRFSPFLCNTSARIDIDVFHSSRMPPAHAAAWFYTSEKNISIYDPYQYSAAQVKPACCIGTILF
jgi:hypothetical protein